MGKLTKRQYHSLSVWKLSASKCCFQGLFVFLKRGMIDMDACSLVCPRDTSASSTGRWKMKNILMTVHLEVSLIYFSEWLTPRLVCIGLQGYMWIYKHGSKFLWLYNSVSSCLSYVLSTHTGCFEQRVLLIGESRVWNGIQSTPAQWLWAPKEETSSCGTMKFLIKPVL